MNILNRAAILCAYTGIYYGSHDVFLPYLSVMPTLIKRRDDVICGSEGANQCKAALPNNVGYMRHLKAYNDTYVLCMLSKSGVTVMMLSI